MKVTKLLETKLKRWFFFFFFFSQWLPYISMCLLYSGNLQIQSATGQNWLYNNLYKKALAYLGSKFPFIQSRQIRTGSAENEQAGPPICYAAAALHAALLHATSIGLLFSEFTLNALSLSYGLPIRQEYGWKKTDHGMWQA